MRIVGGRLRAGIWVRCFAMNFGPVAQAMRRYSIVRTARPAIFGQA